MSVCPKMTIAEAWEAHQMSALSDILEYGTTKPRYRHSLPKRMAQIAATAFCASTFCAPCIIWDCVCCCMFNCCGCSAKHGLGTTFVQKACEETHLDTRKAHLANTRPGDLDLDTMTRVCTKYMEAFTRCAATRLPNDATKANRIRGALVTILQRYTPGYENRFIQDDGNIAAITEAIDRLPRCFASLPRP